jgi:DNA replication protein DnaC
MEKVQTIKNYCKQFNLTAIAQHFDELLIEAETSKISYLDYFYIMLQKEALIREQKSLERRIKVAKLPLHHNLNDFDYTAENGITMTQLSQLRELNWIDQIYNIVLMGPSGTGKTYIAAGLCNEAVIKGYKAYFRTMDDIVTILKTKEISLLAKADYTRLLKANLIVIDDIMMFPIDKQTAVALFNLINQLFEKTAFIITTNKSPKEWAQMLDDEVLATALLDRLLFRCQSLNLNGTSYRMKNRKTIF